MLKQNQVKDPRITLQILLPFRGLPDYLISRWNVQVPEARTFQVGELLASLENRFPMGQLDSLTLSANAATGTVSAAFMFDIVTQP